MLIHEYVNTTGLVLRSALQEPPFMSSFPPCFFLDPVWFSARCQLKPLIIF